MNTHACMHVGTTQSCQDVRWSSEFLTLFHSSADRLLSDPELSATESPLADKKAPGSERAAERAAAAQQNSERARLASQPTYVHMQVTSVPPSAVLRGQAGAGLGVKAECS